MSPWILEVVSNKLFIIKAYTLLKTKNNLCMINTIKKENIYTPFAYYIIISMLGV